MKWSTIIPALLAAWYFIKRWIDKISKVVEPLVGEAEKLAQDGKIDKDDRKKLVMLAIANAEKDGKIKLNFLQRLVISKIVDMIAQKLPDIQVSKDANELINKVVEK